MNKEEIIEFLKQNLEVRMFEDVNHDYGYSYVEIKVELVLNNETISSDSIAIDK